MISGELARWISHLGCVYEELVRENLVPNQPLAELYKGREWLSLDIDEGVELSFVAETRVLESIYITLIRTVEDQAVFTGYLPKPFKNQMCQAIVREIFGSPIDSKGPMELPNLPPMGGVDVYALSAAADSRTQVIFQYTVDLKVDTLVFTLGDG